MKLFKILCFSTALLLGKVACDCFVPMTGYTKYSPLITDMENASEIFYPSLFYENATIATKQPVLRMNCPLGRLTANSRVVEDRNVGLFQCDKRLMKGHWGEMLPFEALKCTKAPDLMVKMTGNLTMKAGVRVLPMRAFDILSFEFDKDLFTPSRQTTVSTIMRPFLKPLPSDSPKFFKGAFYRKIAMNLSDIFRPTYQREKVWSIWRNYEAVDMYFPINSSTNSASRCLVETQLISKNDLYYPFEQEATFLYENVVPVWRAIRNGNWKLAESALRMFAQQLSSEPVTLIAGTQGSWQPNSGKMSHSLPKVHLETTSIEVMNVPSKLFKCVIDKQGNGIAIITFNNPYIKPSIDASCKDTSAYCHSLYPDFNDSSRGFTYCCDIKELPENLRSRCLAKKSV